MKNIFESLLLSQYTDEHFHNITKNGQTNLCELYAAKLLSSSKGIEISGEQLLFLWFLCEQISLGKICFHLLTIDQEIKQWLNNIQPIEVEKRIPFPTPSIKTIHLFIESNSNLFKKIPPTEQESTEAPFYFDSNQYVIFPQRVFLMCKEILKEIHIRNQENEQDIKNWEEISFFLEKNKDPTIKMEDSEIAVCKSILLHKVTVITGGPGTGKTTCVFLGLLTLLYSWINSNKKIFLLAPTGRAAAQLQDSLSKRVLQSSKEIQQIIAKHCVESSTIHSFLKISHQNNSKYSPEFPLEADIIVIDESSMLNMSILYQILSSTPQKTKIIFIGDPFQLPPVKQFNILFILIDTLKKENVKYLVNLEKQRRSQTQIQKISSHLRTFEKDSDIIPNFFKDIRTNIAQKISYITKIPSLEGILQILQIEFHIEKLISLCEDLLPPFIEEKQLRILQKMFSILQNFSFLQATKHTPLGTVAVNEYCIKWLRRYANKIIYPICVTKNEPDLEIHNGDRGWFLEYKNQPQKNVAIFTPPNSQSGYQFISPSLLKIETAFSQTVHKSQGSEFEKVILFLEQESPIVTRSLLYTAITRAKNWFCLISEEDTLQYAIENIPNNESFSF